MQRHKFVFAALVMCLFFCAAPIATANNDNDTDDAARLRIFRVQTFMEDPQSCDPGGIFVSPRGHRQYLQREHEG